LLVAPVGIFGRNAGIDIRPDLLIAEKIDQIAALIDQLLKRARHE
jgi:hypothetical protein